MGGALAVTVYSSNLDQFQNTIANDILIDPDHLWRFGRRDCISGGNEYAELAVEGHIVRPFRPMVVHELGHAHGLAHENRGFLTMMRDAGREYIYPTSCDSAVFSPMPDDSTGGRSLYPSGNTSYDIGTTPNSVEMTTYVDGAFQVVSNPITRLLGGGNTVTCPGTTIALDFAVTNRGTEPIIYRREHRLSRDTIVGSDHYVGAVGNRLKSPGSRGVLWEDDFLTIPSQSLLRRYMPGKYNHFVRTVPTPALPREEKLSNNDGYYRYGVVFEFECEYFSQ